MDIQKYKDELKEIEDFLAKPDAYNSPDFAVKSKRGSMLREIIDLDAKITQMNANLEEAEALVNDPELGEILLRFVPAPEVTRLPFLPASFTACM